MFKNRTIAYIVLTYVLTGLYSLLYLKFPLKVGEPISFAVTVVYMFMPLIATLILQVIVYKEPLKNIGFVFKWSNWYIFAAIAPIVTALMTFGVSFFMPRVTYAPRLAGFMEKKSRL